MAPDSDLAVLAGLLGIPMRAQRVLPGAYDPTGQVFQHPNGGVSTELNNIIGGPGNYQLVPALLPGMPDIQNILAGRPMSADQGRFQEKYAAEHKDAVPTFKTLPEAEDYEQRRHQSLEKNYLPTDPNDMLKALMIYLAGIR